MDYLPHLAALVLNTPLAILPKKAATIAAVLGPRIGVDVGALATPDWSVSAARPATNASIGYAKLGLGVAIISVVGSRVSRASFLEAESGLVSYDRVKRAVLAADRDEEVTSVILDIDSPGGAAAGAFECADVISSVAKRRPVVAVCNQMACSAAYALAAAASRIVAAPSAIVGSIGVIALHVDYSRNLDAHGITPTLIHAGAHKADGNPYEPLADDVRADIQREIDRYMTLFVSSVAAHRPSLTEKAIRATEARTYIGAEAVAVGLVDSVGTIESVISEMAGLHPEAKKKLDKYDRTELLYGKAEAVDQRIQDVHAAGVRAGMAAALAGRGFV
ncbi:S49 family peptidase [Bradyrhizobium sp. MOS001]|uniref:S49 family peptidase n=1 Tax=Bradyrhizobium sp. MOS001 TaxID=2133948 RepID=UPI0010757C18|nr:S49 family peptidase [Bradyrhizobium sp. MOS001]TFW56253.1 S49 family peptidase [Bradyrhizobium sp. MOS001]